MLGRVTTTSERPEGPMDERLATWLDAKNTDGICPNAWLKLT
jgi:hypothetical protein